MTERLPRHSIEKLLAVAAERSAGSRTPRAVEPGGEPGVELGKYRLLVEVGRGGMGVVYAAEDTQLGRRVALKVMPETVGLSDTLRRRFAREAQAAAKLSHPNIATVYEATADFIAMQLVDGSPLSDVPREDSRLIVRLLRDAALAVQFAHERNIIHRDLKPTNMLVEGLDDVALGDESAARIYVMDFGLAKETSIDSSLSGSGSILGTPNFMAPEQAAGRTHDVDERSDVYALGATLYAALTGRPPFAEPGKDVMAVLRRVVEEEARPPGVGTDLDAIVCRCLAKEPERRYASARELADDLNRWLRGETVYARPPSLAYKLSRFVGRRKTVIRAAAVAVAISALILVPLVLREGWHRDAEAAKRLEAERAIGLAQYAFTVLEDVATMRMSGRLDDLDRRLDDAILRCRGFLADNRAAMGYYVLGRLLHQRGDTRAAIDALDAALAGDPDLGLARFERGLVLSSEHRKLAEANAGASRFGALVAAQLEQLRDRAIADLEVRDHELADAREIDLLLGAAELYRLRGDLAMAGQQLEQLLDVFPRHDEARRALDFVRAQRGRGDGAQTDADRSDNAQVDAVAAPHGTGDASTVGRGYARAFLTRDPAPQQPVGWSAFGGWGSGAAAVPIESAPLVHADALVATLDVRTSDSEPQSADEAGLSAMREADRHGAAGRVADAFTAWQRAIARFDAVLRADPKAGAHHNRGVCWMELEQLLLARERPLEAIAAHRSALSDLERAIALAPRFAAAYRNRAVLRLRQSERLRAFGRLPAAAREDRQAIGDLKLALTLAPADWPDRESCERRLGEVEQRLGGN